ncbi:MAG: ABC transporter ATP-binding protein [Coriobacteriales bacterium]|nr:ABC transporter ATP-binding protein [Coriobacteriales bacterium]
MQQKPHVAKVQHFEKPAPSLHAIEFDKVNFSYGALSQKKYPILNDVTLKIARGECVCLTGPSGCGKTTLTRLCNGLIPTFYEGVKQGRVLIDGIELEQWEMDDLCRVVGSVFQNPRSQFFNLDTTSELAYGCENLGIRREEILNRVAQTVETLGLQNLLERDIHDLSGGQRQLLALGTVCAMGTEIFILDEPTANLDAAATQAVKRTLQRLKELKKTILIVEHRLHWLEGLVDRVVCMSEGHIVHDWHVQEFAALPPRTTAELGLRAWALRDLCLGPQAQTSREHPRDTARALDIQADGIRAGYGPRREILKGLSFSATGGHAIAVVGRNGQGKSTLAQVMAGLLRETYGGLAISAQPLDVRRRTGCVYLVLQESGYQLFGTSVRKEFEISLAPAGSAASRAPVPLGPAHIDELIERFGLSGTDERHPASLSGGEKQRLAVAVGVYAGAKVLVLDEPTSGLDLANMRRCAGEIRRLADEGRCIFVITHDAELVTSACDQVIEVADGRVRSAYELTDETLPRVLEVLAPDHVGAEVSLTASGDFGRARKEEFSGAYRPGG